MANLEKILEYNPDILLIGIQNYVPIYEDFRNKFKNTKIKILAKKSLKDSIKDIWT